MKIWHISDTHGFHNRLEIPENIDLVIHSGDAGNYSDPYRSEPEIRDFANWFASLDITHKIYVAGNHDSALEKKLLRKKFFDMLNINYLENTFIDIEGIKIWGSPYTPWYGNWSFMRDRSKLNKLWQTIPDDTDIVIVHGPPKGILDISESKYGDIEFCGDSALNKRILKLKLKLVCFGHIHNTSEIINAGVFKPANFNTVYSNGSVMTDAKFKYGPTSNGNLFEYNIVTKTITILDMG